MSSISRVGPPSYSEVCGEGLSRLPKKPADNTWEAFEAFARSFPYYIISNSERDICDVRLPDALPADVVPVMISRHSIEQNGDHTHYGHQYAADEDGNTYSHSRRVGGRSIEFNIGGSSVTLEYLPESYISLSAYRWNDQPVCMLITNTTSLDHFEKAAASLGLPDSALWTLALLEQLPPYIDREMEQMIKQFAPLFGVSISDVHDLYKQFKVVLK